MFKEIGRQTGMDLSEFDTISCQGSGPKLGGKIETTALLSALATSKEKFMKGEFAQDAAEFDLEKAKKPYVTSYKGSIGH
mmetsp:Transcript_1159/g.721  ORF Transcript_1159/g.721 Transcript_1159/m.721 type:complete len:80 (-) Transcript_1159:214-453(-)